MAPPRKAPTWHNLADLKDQPRLATRRAVLSALHRAGRHPSTILRLKKMNMINAGMVTTKMFANSRLYWVVNWLLKLNWVSAESSRRVLSKAFQYTTASVCMDSVNPVLRTYCVDL